MSAPLSFWNDLAKRYPSFDDPAMAGDVVQMIQCSESAGIDFRHRRVLDIGCGTGTVAIPLALRGAHVTAVDISEKMLQICRNDARRAGVAERIVSEQSDWKSYAVNAKHDIVVVSMTPAVSSGDEVDKMLQTSTKAGIYVGWGSYRINTTVRKLFEAHGHSYPMQYGHAEHFLVQLDRRGIEGNLNRFTTAWEERMPIDEAKAYACTQLKRHNVEPDEMTVESVLDGYRKGTSVSFVTEAEKGVVTWRM
jgi:SAM-dependent methyltransferase